MTKQQKVRVKLIELDGKRYIELDPLLIALAQTGHNEIVDALKDCRVTPLKRKWGW